MLRPKKCKSCGKMQTGGVLPNPAPGIPGVPVNRRPQTIDEANIYARDLAKRRGLVSGENTNVGNQLPTYRDAQGNILPDTWSPIPQSSINNYIPPSVTDLQWSSDANLPYYTDPNSGDMVYTNRDNFYLPRFQKNRGQTPEQLGVSNRTTTPVPGSTMAMRMYGGRLQRMQQGGFPGIPNPNGYVTDDQLIPGVNSPLSEIPVTAQTQTAMDPLQDMMAKGLMDTPNGYNNPQDWYSYMNQQAPQQPAPRMRGNTLQNIGIGMMQGSNLLSEISGRVERGRQNRYDYQQQTALGMQTPSQVSDYQPTPYSLYAKYGGKLKHYQQGGPTPRYKFNPYFSQPVPNARDSAEYRYAFNGLMSGEQYHRKNVDDTKTALYTLPDVSPAMLQFHANEDAGYTDAQAQMLERYRNLQNKVPVLPALQQGGTRKPIYTHNPNDPRVKAYQDSLRDFERAREYLATKGNISDMPYYEPEQAFIGLRDDWNKFPGMKATTDDTQTHLEKGIRQENMPIGYYRVSSQDYRPEFKKPVQPILYTPAPPIQIQRPSPPTTTKPVPKKPVTPPVQDSIKLKAFQQGGQYDEQYTFPLDGDTAWANKLFPSLTTQGLASETMKLNRGLDPRYSASVPRRKIQLLQDEMRRREAGPLAGYNMLREQLGLPLPSMDVPKREDGGKVYLGRLKKGGIHIKPENKGKFTEYCGGKVTDECIQRGLHSDSSTIRKRANFARNARKWN